MHSKVTQEPDSLPTLEVRLFNALNRYVEPLIRRGVGSPCISPGGLVVLETVGRKSGKIRRTPLAAARLGDRIIVSTFRENKAQWLRNLAVDARAAVWVGGKRRSVSAHRLDEKGTVESASITRVLQPLIDSGWAFVLLRTTY